MANGYMARQTEEQGLGIWNLSFQLPPVKVTMNNMSLCISWWRDSLRSLRTRSNTVRVQGWAKEWSLGCVNPAS